MLTNESLYTTLTWSQLVIGLSLGLIPVAMQLITRHFAAKRRDRKLADAYQLGQTLILDGKPARSATSHAISFDEVILVPPPPPSRQLPASSSPRPARSNMRRNALPLATKRRVSPLATLRTTSRARSRARQSA